MKPLTDDGRALLRMKILASVSPSAAGCWEWLGGRQSNGYGRIRAGRSMGVHRAAYRAFVGEIPDGLDVCHRCDNRICCNPDHLFTGTRMDNMQDAVAKGRTARGAQLGDRTGERGSASKLTWPAVRAVRAMAAYGVPQKLIAAVAGVDQTNISSILLNKTWREAA